MNEHVKHVNYDINRFLDLEHGMGEFIKDHSALPNILKSFVEIPNSLEKHMVFVQTLEE